MKRFLLIAISMFFFYSIAMAQQSIHFDWINAEPDTIYADGNLTYSEITVKVVGEEGNPIEDSVVHFSSDIGNIIYITYTNEFGVASTTFWDGYDVGTAHITADAAGEDIISIQVEILPMDEQYDSNIVSSPIVLRTYPNPFNPTVTFNFNISEKEISKSKMEIFNIKGQKVGIIRYNEFSKSNSVGFTAVWDAKNNTSGTYFCRLSINDKIIVYKKITLLK